MWFMLGLTNKTKLKLNWRAYQLSQIWTVRCVKINYETTVKLGYNELGYYELPVITNKMLLLVGSDLF